MFHKKNFLHLDLEINDAKPSNTSSSDDDELCLVLDYPRSKPSLDEQIGRAETKVADRQVPHDVVALDPDIVR